MYRLKTPQAPLAITTLGLIPFLATAGLIFHFREDSALQQAVGLWLIAYSAVILSFLGGIRWGVEIAQRDKPRFIELGTSILGVLVAWGTLLAFILWQPDRSLFLVLACALLLQWFWDFASTRLPTWYQKLRLWPTIGAIASLIGAYALFGGA